MLSSAAQHRRGVTVIEMMAVMMILGILAAIAAPRLLYTMNSAVDAGVERTLGVIRTAIHNFAAHNEGRLPGADGSEKTFKTDLAEFLRDDFPACAVGAAKNDLVKMMSGSGSIGSSIGATDATHSWVYQFETGEFFVNSTGKAFDGVRTYDQF